MGDLFPSKVIEPLVFFNGKSEAHVVIILPSLNVSLCKKYC